MSDLFRPHNDPDDHWDLACAYALAYQGRAELQGILIDYPQPARHNDPVRAAHNVPPFILLQEHLDDIHRNREDFHRAFYYFVKAEMEPTSILDLEHQIKFDEDIIRHMVVVEE